MFAQLRKLITDIREAHIPQWLFALIIAGASIGLLDASYLSYQHKTTPPAGDMSVLCVVGEPGSCNAVLQSQYAVVLGIPLAYIGVLYYLTILVTAIILFRTRAVRAWYVLQTVLAVGFLASAYFVYLQLFVIYSICLYCMISAVMTAGMCGGVIWQKIKHRV
jgi:uncharacterized membrane protein